MPSPSGCAFPDGLLSSTSEGLPATKLPPRAVNCNIEVEDNVGFGEDDVVDI